VLRVLAAAPHRPAVWHPGLAALYAAVGMLDDARTLFEELAADDFAGIPRDSVFPACITFVAEVCLALGDAQRAPLVMAALAPFAGRNLMAGMTMCFGPADRLLGGLAALVGRHDTADAHLRNALALAERSGSPVWQAHVLHDWAAVAAERGDGAGAAVMHAQSQEIAERLGMGSLAGAPVAHVRATVTAMALPGGLSSRELDVLRLVAAGLSNREIGLRLHISQNTVANHVRAILQKTACANRAEAVAYAARHHLLTA
jgi:DNA-binding CsgD family transcriptional regulator